MKLVFYNLSDVDLIKIIQETNDNSAVETLIKRYDYLINGKTIQFYRNNFQLLDLNDIKQEATYAVYRAALTYSDELNISFATYASKCIDNRIINLIKKEKRHSSKFDFNDDIDIQEKNDINMSETSSSPEDILIEKDTLEKIINIINTFLSKEEKDVLIYKFKGLSYEEIAKLMDISKKNVDNIYTSIKRKIRNHLKKETKS